jgi:hypothetical protein
MATTSEMETDIATESVDFGCQILEKQICSYDSQALLRWG